MGRCERFVLNTLFLSLVVSLWQRSFQKYQQKNHYQKFPQKNLVCMSCLVHLCTVRFFNPFFVVPKNIHTHPIVDFLDLNCSFVSYYPFKIVFQVRPPFTLEFWNHTLLWNLLQERLLAISQCMFIILFFSIVEKRPQKEKKDERKAEVVPAL